ncbi:MAG TPA: DUF488 domain-containing protein [Thermoanaerobaculia bacterium]
MRPVFTVGHSNHSLEKFLGILAAHGVARIADVRRFPASRRWPHFGAERLEASLAAAGIAYSPMPELGGRRRARPDSPHVAWRVEAFRGYADYMDTPEFAAALTTLIPLTQETATALMCAEAMPWSCHRSLIADALMVRGFEVREILSEKEARPRKLAPFARVEGERLIYDGGELPLG